MKLIEAIKWLEENENLEVEEITSKWKVKDLDDYRGNCYFENDEDLIRWIEAQKEDIEKEDKD